MKHLVASIVAATACSTSAPATTTHENFADVGFDAPVGWSHQEIKGIGRVTSRWVPDENGNKESISIIRTPLRPQLRGAPIAELQELLASAQETLPSPSVRAANASRTKRDLQEIEISSDFVPSGMTARYHRVHALVIDGDTLIHVLYTARNPDPYLTAFHGVVDSIHREVHS